MRLPRNIKMLRGPVDPAALAGTLFLLWTTTLLHSSLVVPAGARVSLPDAAGLWGDKVPDLSIAVDARGRVFYEHQVVTESNLQVRLRERITRGGPQQTLLLLVDRKVTLEVWTRLVNLARTTGFEEVILATSPRPGLGPRLAPASAGDDADGG